MILETFLLFFLGPATAAADAETVDHILSSYQDYEAVASHVMVHDPELLTRCTDFHRRQYGPHVSSSLPILMNPDAAAAFRSTRTPYPAGSVIVKLKENEYGVVNAVGGMVKRSTGYDSSNGDWEYFYAQPGRPARSGRLENCNSCHLRAAATDHVFGDWSSLPPAPLTE